jgi:hypothetical protein
MCIGSCLGSNPAQSSAISSFLSDANNTTKPVEVLTNTESQVVASKDENNVNFVKQEVKSIASTVAIAIPAKDYIQQGLQIMGSNSTIGRAIVDIRTRDYTDVNGIESTITTEFNNSVKIFFPTDIHMVAAAAYYKKKYGINIHIVCEHKANKTYDLMQQLNDGEQLGIIARISRYLPHVTPLIISRKGEDIFIVSLDSIDIMPTFVSGVKDFFKENLMDIEDKKSYHLILVDAKRQADLYSCRNDAIIILKDALRKPDVVSCFQSFTKRVDADVYSASDDDRVVLSTYDANLPAFLYKTVQINTMIINFNKQDRDTVLKTSKAGKIKTLQTHLDEYKQNVTVKKVIHIKCNIRQNSATGFNRDSMVVDYKQWVVNGFLQEKGFRVLVKSFSELNDGTGKIDKDKQKLLLSEYFYADY